MQCESKLDPGLQETAVHILDKKARIFGVYPFRRASTCIQRKQLKYKYENLTFFVQSLDGASKLIDRVPICLRGARTSLSDDLIMRS